MHGATAGARDALPAALRARLTLPVTVGSVVSYLDGPVGPYSEVLASPLALAPRGEGHVTFMAVDSERSVAGGRENWALPKELARFRPVAGGVRAEGERWTVDVRGSVRSRSVMVSLRGACVQDWPGGVLRRFTFALRGEARLARVTVDARGVGELRSGRFPALWLRGTQEVRAPRPEPV